MHKPSRFCVVLALSTITSTMTCQLNAFAESKEKKEASVSRAATTEDALLVESANNKSDKQRDYKGAIEDATKALKINPKNENAFTARAWAKMWSEDYIGAINDCDEAIKLAPNWGWPWAVRGQTNFYLEDYDQSIADYTTSISYDSSYSWSFYFRGKAYYLQKDYNKAVKDFNKAINLNPKDWSSHWDRGWLYIGIKNYNGAKLDGEACIAISPNGSAGGDGHRLLGAAYDWLDKKQEAIAEYKKAAELYGAANLPDWVKTVQGYITRLEAPAARGGVALGKVRATSSRVKPAQPIAPSALKRH